MDKQRPVEQSAVFESMDTLRQRHVRQAIKEGGSVKRSDDSKLLMSYFKMLMARQEIIVEESKLERTQRLLNGLAAVGWGSIYHVLNKAGDIIYAVAYGWDAKRAYYLFGAGNPDVSAPWQGTLAHWEAFTDMSQRLGITEVDLEGVNSPKRGWFKLGFGGNLKPYFHVYKRL
jgi:lipid II:glycine glycyltransferase (peptidoglycan interpeptide bridge formation enzyme)